MEDNYTYDQAALSRSEADLNADVQDPEPKYDQPPLSRIEYLLQQIAGGVSSGIHLRGVVSSDEGLPETAENGDMYFVGPDANGAYREVVWLNSKEDWEELGYNAIDVDAFVKKNGDIMAGPLYAPNDAAQTKLTQFLRLGLAGAYSDAIETYLASDRGEAAVNAFYQAIAAATISQMEEGVGPYNGSDSHSINNVGFQMHWHGQGPSWNIPSDSYNNLSDNNYTVILDDAVSIRKRRVIYTDETGYVPFILKGEVADGSELPSNPENGWAYINTSSELPSGEHGVLTYSSKLGTWIFTLQWGSYTNYKEISMQMAHAAVFSRDDIADKYTELEEANLLRDDTYVPKGYVDYKVETADHLPSDANLIVATSAGSKKIVLDTLFQPTAGNDLVPKSYVDNKVSSEFESNLLAYIDAHTITQAAYDALTDKTGFWFIKEAAT